MIRHIVLVKSDDRIVPILEKLRAFCAEFEGVLAFSSDTNRSIEPEVMHGFAHGFVIDFASEAARDAYVKDAGHQAIGAEIVAMAKGGRDGVVVFDLRLDK